ncbi:MAG TPA: helicase-related protein, partial [Candidatus Binatus sp.]|nr:helicase-related protein [Candidatus Binatus sp.]
MHHGSLAKPSRITAERGLKDGQLKGLIATSSLELGIDVGRIDYVIQYMSPHQVTRLIQRVGRSGHSIGQMADGIIITIDPDDTLEAMVITRRALDEVMETVTVPEKPLDALTHQIAGLLIQNRKWYANELVDMLSKAYPYKHLTEKDVMSIANYMYSRFPRLAWVSEQDKLLMRPQRIKYLYLYYFNKLSMIPDQKQYLIIDQSNDSAVGVLDEAFVAEHGEPGTKFIVRGSAWKMISIRGDKIYVVPVIDPSGAIPSWVGEEIPVPFDIAEEVGSIRRRVDELRTSGKTLGEVAGIVSRDYEVDETTCKRAIQDTYQQSDMGVPVPSDKLVTVEKWDDFVIVNSHYGTLVNRTLARLVGHFLSDEAGASIGIQQDPYRMVFQSPGVIG